MKIRSLFIAAVIFFGTSLGAQQLPQSNLYNFNPYGINPAYAGFNGCLEAYGSHLSQWVGIDGAPVTSYFSAHAGLGENMGLGGGIILDKAAYVSRFSGRLSYAYRIKLGDDHNLRFGLAGGVYQVKIDATNATVDDMTDEVIAGGAQSGMTFDSEFGIFYNYKGFQLGLSIPQVLETRAKLDFQDLDGFTGTRHFVGYTGYKWEASDKWEVEPSILFKTAGSSLSQLDINAMVTYNNLISLGGGYRTHIGPLARLGINIKDMFVIGYAYEFAGANISSYSNGSHEVMLGFKFCGEKEPAIVSLAAASLESSAPAPPEEEEEEPEEVEEPVEEIEEVEEPEIEEPVIRKTITSDEVKAFDIAVQFPLNGTRLNSSFYDELDRIAGLMKTYPDLSLEVTGHSCDLGDSNGKKAVSQTRANVVKTYLIKKGVSANRIQTKAMSDSQPVLPNSSEENRAKNRRVEFTLR